MEVENLNIICKMRHGSHLYGLNTENSDVDYKGVFLPTIEELVLGNAPGEYRSSTGDQNSKNGAGDIDEVYFSLHKFLKMAADGETIALDMLHCNNKNMITGSNIWDMLVENRSAFYTKNMKAFLGYCKQQAHKYGVKGSRLAAIKDAFEYLDVKLAENDNNLCMNDPYILFGLGGLSEVHPEYIRYMPEGFYKNDKFVPKPMFEVCGAKYDLSTKVSYVSEQLKLKYNSYGERARMAENNEGIDWKAISHAIRAGLQLKEIYQTGDLQYPLKDREFILEVKKGQLDFTTIVQPYLEHLVDEIEDMAEVSELPNKVNRKESVENFILMCYLGVEDNV